MSDVHPEDFCERCGGNNPVWSVDSDRWNVAHEALDLPRGVVLCPGCFVEGHEKASGMRSAWTLSPVMFRHLDWWTDPPAEEE